MFEEGQIADGPNGPLVYRGGRWYPLQQAQQPPADPTFPFKGPQAEADTRKAQAEAALAAAQAPYAGQIAQAEVQKALAEAEKARAEASRDPNAQRLDRGKVGQFLALENQLADVRRLYRQGPGSTSGIGGVLDYLPSDANAAFDSAGAGLSEVGLAAFRVPGVGSQSDAELRQFIMANTPSAGDRDAAIEQKLRNLENRLASVKQAWGVDPKAPAAQLLQQFGDDPNANTNALGQLRTSNAAPPAEAVPLADSGSVQYRDVENPALRRAHDDLVQTMLAAGGGRIDPQEYARRFSALANEFEQDDPVGPQGRMEWAQAMNAYLDSGGRTINTSLSSRELMTAADIGYNNLVNNPFTGAVAGVANTVGFGVPEALAPGQYQALRDSQGAPVFVGEVGGAIAGTYGLGRLGRAVANRVAPSALGGGTTGQALRNVATDATYGGIYGQTTRGDPATGAALGAAGSVVGQGVARGLGAAVGGVRRTAAAEALRNQGVPISVARQLGMGRAEDAMGSLPIAGDVARARQLDSFMGLDRAMMAEGGQPIGFAPTQAGREGVDSFGDAVSDAYTNATRGIAAQVDTQTFRDLRPVMQAIRGLPEDYRAAAETILERRVAPALEKGTITGEQYQQALRGIKQARANAGKNPSLAGFEEDFRKALTGVEDMLTSTMTRGAGPEVAATLGAANAANRGLKVAENTLLDRAAVGTQAGVTNVATPAQWLGALRQAERQGFGENVGMRNLAEAGQEVLPSRLPNSGTVDRTVALSLLTAAPTLGAGAGFASDQSGAGAATGAASGLGTLAAGSLILAALGTRGGQKALEKVLMERPQAVRGLGEAVRRRGGLFGTGGSVIALQGQ